MTPELSFPISSSLPLQASQSTSVNIDHSEGHDDDSDSFIPAPRLQRLRRGVPFVDEDEDENDEAHEDHYSGVLSNSGMTSPPKSWSSSSFALNPPSATVTTYQPLDFEGLYSFSDSGA